MSSARRLLVLSGYPAIGGPLPKLTPFMIDGFRSAGFEVRFLGWSAHTADHEPMAAKVRGRGGDLARVLRCIRTWRPDALYVATAHNPPGLARDLPLALATAGDRPAFVLHFHGSESHRLVAPGNAVLKAASRMLVKRTDAVLLLSQEERREWERFCPGVRYDVVINPFLPQGRAVARGAEHDGVEPHFLLVARLIPEKGCFDLLQAFAQVRNRRPCRLVIAGKGPAREEIVRCAASLGVLESVDLLGYVSGPQLEEAYRRADVFVLPSYFPEGFPLSVMEAMGYALPIVTTRIRGCADHLEEGVNALFVPPRDAGGLAAALDRLLDDEQLRRTMGAANAIKVDEFAPAKVVPAYVGVIEAVMRRPAA